MSEEENNSDVTSEPEEIVEIKPDTTDEESSIEDIKVNVNPQLFVENSLPTLQPVATQIIYYVPQQPMNTTETSSSQSKRKRARLKKRSKDDGSSSSSDDSDMGKRGRLKKASTEDWNGSGESSDENDETKIGCPYCPRKFKRKGSLTAHLKWKHPVNKTSDNEDAGNGLAYPYNLFASDDILNEATEEIRDIDSGDENTESNALEEPVAYLGDDQILQRYLYDASVKITGESSAPFIAEEVSATSLLEEAAAPYLIEGPPPLYDKREVKKVGIDPAKIGVKFEDCEFNSSDSFESTESIVEKTYKCGLCPKRFMFKSDMFRHHPAKHANSKYKCQYCKAEVISEAALKAHWKKLHSKNKGEILQIN